MGVGAGVGWWLAGVARPEPGAVQPELEGEWAEAGPLKDLAGPGCPVPMAGLIALAGLGHPVPMVGLTRIEPLRPKSQAEVLSGPTKGGEEGFCVLGAEDFWASEL